MFIFDRLLDQALEVKVEPGAVRLRNRTGHRLPTAEPHRSVVVRWEGGEYRIERVVDAYRVREKPGHLIYGFAEFMRQSQAVRRLGSAALDLCYTATGRFDAFYEESLQSWDIAAGALLVEEAGGRVTGTRGEPFTAHAGHVVASNGHLHDVVLSTLDIVRRNHPD